MMKFGAYLTLGVFLIIGLAGPALLLYEGVF